VKVTNQLPYQKIYDARGRDGIGGWTDMDISKLEHAYRSGANPAGKDARYYCQYCDLQLFGDEVGYVAAGATYANGEHSACPRCGEENAVFRDIPAMD
jgi:transposase-like protein